MVSRRGRPAPLNPKEASRPLIPRIVVSLRSASPSFGAVSPIAGQGLILPWTARAPVRAQDGQHERRRVSARSVDTGQSSTSSYRAMGDRGAYMAWMA